MPKEVVMAELKIMKEAMARIEESYGGGDMGGEGYEEDGGMDYNEGSSHESSHKMPPARGRRGKMQGMKYKNNEAY